jgi:hypothetical protein
MRWVCVCVCVCVCGRGEEKRKLGGNMGGGEKKKEKRNGEWGLHIWWEKRGSGKERRKKN